MGGSSSIMKPQELTEFRKLNTSVENVEIPARSESRTLTDKKGFIIYGIAILIFLALLGYSLAKSDIRRLTHGFDSCGNLCGYNNSVIKDVPCSGKNYISMPYYNLARTRKDETREFEHSECVTSCPRGREPDMFGECEITKSESTEYNVTYINVRSNGSDIKLDLVLQNCRTHWWKFVLSIIITLMLCLCVLFLLRFSPGVVVWTVLAIGILAAIAATGGFWYVYFTKKTDEEIRTPALAGGVILTIFTIAVIITLMCLFKKIRLVILLYQEATKAVFAMPLLILVPILLTVFQLIIFISFITSTLWLMTSAELKKYGLNYYEYDMNGAMTFTIVLNLIMTSWSMQFVAGIQYLVISGSIAAWYFAKNKQYLDSPICTSFRNAFKYHIGTVAFGSFILTLMAVIKALIQSLFKNEKLRCVVECCCENVEAFLKFLSKNAYIETAIHGQSFLRSGKRAAKLLLTNATSVIAINSVGDFVLGMIEFMLLVISTAISVILWKNVEHFWLPSLICFFINLAIIVVIFAIFETTIDTLFICFCEDKVINDGISKPYFMSRGLMEFVENSKKVYGKQDQQ